MKFLNVPISVEARKGVPRRIRWGRRTYTVRRLLDFWILQSRWWAREEKRIYFRLETDGGVLEIYRGEEGGESRGPVRAGAGGTHPGHAHPPFVEGDTHTRELRQTESPYRPDAAALAGRRFEEASPRELLQTSGEVGSSGKKRRSPTNSEEVERGFNKTSPPTDPSRWVLSKVVD